MRQMKKRRKVLQKQTDAEEAETCLMNPKLVLFTFEFDSASSSKLINPNDVCLDRPQHPLAFVVRLQTKKS